MTIAPGEVLLDMMAEQSKRLIVEAYAAGFDQGLSRDDPSAVDVRALAEAFYEAKWPFNESVPPPENN